MVWKIKLSPQNLLRLTAPNARLSVSAARDALNGSEASSRTPSFYQMQIYETYALPFASFVMLLLGLPSAFSQSRQGRGMVAVCGGGNGFVVRAYHRNSNISRASRDPRSEEHTSELQSLMRISYAVFCYKKKKKVAK